MQKKKKRLRFRSLIFIVLFGYLLFMIGYYFYNLPVKNIYVKGNDLLSDQEIIDISKLKDYPSIFKYSKRQIKKNVLKLELVDDVKVTKNFLGRVTIYIEEAKPVFYYKSIDDVYLSNGRLIKNNSKILGIPLLVNYVPSKILDDLINNFQYLSNDVVAKISEIVYEPDEKNGVVLDDNRFLLRMIDTNSVYIDTINLEKLNNYQKICATLDDGVHGYIYLNSNRDNASFQAYGVKSDQVES